jgi:hypothetical protein
VLFSAWHAYARVARDFLPRLVAPLSDKVAPDGAATGAVYVVSDGGVLRTVVRSWQWLELLVGHLLGSSVHDRPTLQLRLQSLFGALTQAAYPLPIAATRPPAAASPAVLAALGLCLCLASSRSILV